MKTEDKEAFYMQYYGQKVLYRKYDADSKDPNRTYMLDGSKDISHEVWGLLLKPVSEITHADTIDLFTLKFTSEDGGRESNLVEIIPNISTGNDDRNKVSLECIIHTKNWDPIVDRIFIGGERINYKYIDFIRSRGYLVPFREYSSRQLLEMGWVKFIN